MTFDPDVRVGDILVVDGVEYPIKSAAPWSPPSARGVAPSFRRICTVQASTKRSPGVVNGKRGEPEICLADLRCTPLDPVNSEIQQRVALNTPITLLQTFAGGSNGFYHLVVEDLLR